MRISLQSTIHKPSSCKGKVANGNNSELKNLFENMIQQRKDLQKAKINWVDDETVELTNVTNQNLHAFLLEAERQGKDISFTKQTVITIK